MLSRLGVVRPIRPCWGLRQICASTYVCAGHSKWANIRHDKAKNDARRLKQATLLLSRIEASVRAGGIDANAQLDTFIDQAKKLNVPKKIIELAISRGQGESASDGPVCSAATYEFVGPGGILFLVAAVTDNKARTILRVKSAMKEFGANMSPCLYMFERMGEVIFMGKTATESLDDIMEVAIEVEAEDVDAFEDEDAQYGECAHPLFRIRTMPEDVFKVLNALRDMGYELKDSLTTYISQGDSIAVPEDSLKLFKKAIDGLDSCQEVTEWWTNAE